MFAFDNFEIGALYLIQDFMRTPKLTDFLESMTVWEMRASSGWLSPSSSSARRNTGRSGMPLFYPWQ